MTENGVSETVHKPRFVPGGAAGPGRPRGIKDRRTTAKEAKLDLIDAGILAQGLKATHERWIELLTDTDPYIRLSAEKFLWEQQHGKAKLDVEVTDARETMREAADFASKFLIAANGNGVVAN